ncbi:MAG: RNA polymerase Rpb4 family protein [Candidatus Bathyarchaeia archaeon]
MPRKILEETKVTVAEVGRILEQAKEGELGEFQRRVLEYAQKFSKLKPDKARRLMKELMSTFSIESKEAAQIVNCMPRTVGELRTILTVKGKIYATEQLQEIVKTIDKYRM